MGYIYLTIGIAAEAIATIFLKEACGFTILLPSLLCVALYVLCNLCIARALLSLKMSIAYATWYGAGVGIAALLSVFWYHEGLSLCGAVGLGVIVGGIIIANTAE